MCFWNSLFGPSLLLETCRELNKIDHIQLNLNATHWKEDIGHRLKGNRQSTHR